MKSKKAIEMKIIYMIIAIILLIWAIFFIKGIRESIIETITAIFG